MCGKFIGYRLNIESKWDQTAPPTTFPTYMAYQDALNGKTWIDDRYLRHQLFNTVNEISRTSSYSLTPKTYDYILNVGHRYTFNVGDPSSVAKKGKYIATLPAGNYKIQVGLDKVFRKTKLCLLCGRSNICTKYVDDRSRDSIWTYVIRHKGGTVQCLFRYNRLPNEYNIYNYITINFLSIVLYQPNEVIGLSLSYLSDGSNLLNIGQSVTCDFHIHKNDGSIDYYEINWYAGNNILSSQKNQETITILYDYLSPIYCEVKLFEKGEYSISHSNAVDIKSCDGWSHYNNEDDILKHRLCSCAWCCGIGYECLCDYSITSNLIGYQTTCECPEYYINENNVCVQEDLCIDNQCDPTYTESCENNFANNTYICNCKSSFTGQYCNIYIDPCESSPCINATCSSPSIGIFQCTCENENYRLIDDIECKLCPYYNDTDNICNHNVNMNNTCAEDATCNCEEPWVGDSCQYSPETTCSSKGTVSFDGICTCLNERYTGDDCSLCIDYLSGDNCQNVLSSYSCLDDCEDRCSNTNCKTCLDYISQCTPDTCLPSFDYNGLCDGEPFTTIACNDTYIKPQCSKTCTGMSDMCESCSDGYYLSNFQCLQCPSCNNVGDCSDNGQCLCNNGYAGSNCQFSDQITCNNHGEVKVDDNDIATCTCRNSLLDSTNCTSCADYFILEQDAISNELICIECLDNVHCNNKGYCNIDGSCTCNSNFDGKNCDICAINYYGTNCDYCERNTTCNNHGTCIDNDSSSYACQCDLGYAGINCKSCDDGYLLKDINEHESICVICPINDEGNICSNHGQCILDQDNQAICNCNDGYRGELCSSPILDQLEPTILSSSSLGGKHIILHGKYLLGNKVSVYINEYKALIKSNTFAIIECYVPYGSIGLANLTVIVDDIVSNNLQFNYTLYDKDSIIAINNQISPLGGSLLINGYGLGMNGTFLLANNDDSLAITYDTSICDHYQLYDNILLIDSNNITVYPPIDEYQMDVNCLLYENITCNLKSNKNFFLDLEFEQDIYITDILFKTTNLTALTVQYHISYDGSTFYTGQELLFTHDVSNEFTFDIIKHELAIFTSYLRIESKVSGIDVNLLQVKGSPCKYNDHILWNHNQIALAIPSLTNNITYAYNVTFIPQISGIVAEDVDQIQFNVNFLYKQAIINSFTPNTGGNNVNITIYGQHFGANEEYISIWFKKLSDNSTFSCINIEIIEIDTIVQCTINDIVGNDNQLYISISSQQSTFTDYYYQTNLPIIKANENCNSQDIITDNCQQDELITIYGDNFGINTKYIKVYIMHSSNMDHNLCNEITSTIADHDDYQYILTCKLPNGMGKNLDIIINIGGQETRKDDAISYWGPIITANTLLLNSNIIHTNPIILTTTSANDILHITGEHFAINKDENRVIYGSIIYDEILNTNIIDYQYNCTIISSTSTSIDCLTSQGIGKLLYFQVYTLSNTNQWLSSSLSSDLISYPSPIITASTLRLLNGNPSNHVDGILSKGDIIQFNGLYFGHNPLYRSIHYKSSNSESSYSNICDETDNSNDTFIECYMRLGFFSQGPMVFQVTVGFIPNHQHIVIGTDTYTYPKPPEILSITGCISDNEKTIDCPTSALNEHNEQVRITINGIDLGTNNLEVFIAGTLCDNLIYTIAEQQVECDLPPGIGINVPVTLYLDSLISDDYYLLSYAKPSIIKISGCDDIDDYTINCSRTSNPLITITGNNFGHNAASILIGGIPCTNVIHDMLLPHAKLTCNLSNGQGTDLTVIVLQSGGLISTNLGTLSYQQCNYGFYNDINSYSCKGCIAGKYSNQYDSVECLYCPNGRYSNKYAADCIKCPVGRYAAVIGQVECTKCPVGKFASNENSLSCFDCASGYYNDIEEADICLPCTPGKYSTQGLSSCAECNKGYYQSSFALSACEPCPKGTYANETASSECKIAPAGYYINDIGQNDYQPCNAGYFSEAGSISCTECPSGKYNQQTGSSACIDCSPGKFAKNDGSTICLECSAGKFSNTWKSNLCRDCPSGKFSKENSIACEDCSPGKYQDREASDTCLSCSNGEYTNSYGSIECTQCSPGSYIASLNATSCLLCDAGKYQNFNGQSTCIDCSAGSSSWKLGDIECISCNDGTYTNKTGSTSCILCPAGTYSDNFQTNCVACEAGKYSKDGSSSCIDCDSGRYSNKTNAIYCEPCEAGRSQAKTGQSSCNICVAGTMSQKAKNSIACDLCIFGTYQPNSEQSSCISCDAGTYVPNKNPIANNNTGFTSCIDCEVGKYQSQKSSASCVDCQLGKYQSLTKQQECNSCSGGTYSELGQSYCKVCEVGKYIDSSSASSCIDCSPGSYTNTTKNIQCQLCSPGYYQMDSGKTKCNECNVGTYYSSDGGELCNDCPRGRYANITGLSECILCEPGKYQPNIGASFCYLCDIGTKNQEYGQYQCEKCADGTFQNITGQSSCQLCPIGEYSSSVNQLNSTSHGIECLKCIPGTYNPFTSQSSCLQCDAGSYTNTYGQYICKKCQAGTYSTKRGQTTCIPCTTGSYQKQSGQTYCSLCDIGKYNYEISSSICLDCIPGTYNTKMDSSFCNDCSAGQYNADYGTSSCSLCPLGTYQNNTSSSSCLLCPAGTYQDHLGKTKCNICAIGKFSKQGYPECALCSSQEVAPTFGAKECILCDNNGIANNDRSYCICKEGYYVDPLTQHCKKCPLGINCNIEGVTVNTMNLKQGFWRDNIDSTVIHRCLSIEHCLGGIGLTECGINRDSNSPLCSLCQDGYSARTSISLCEQCQDKQQNIIITILFAIISAIIIIILYKFILRYDSSAIKQSKYNHLQQVKKLEQQLGHTQHQKASFFLMKHFDQELKLSKKEEEEEKTKK